MRDITTAGSSPEDGTQVSRIVLASSADSKVEYKDVVIVGNGPSAITLSYFLAGYWPYYGSAVHPIAYLHAKLDANRHKSLLEQDLEYLCQGLEGRSNNPVSVLFDTLNRPDADLGVEASSYLEWVKQEDKVVEHVVLGKGNPGGAWQNMEGSTLTLSLSSWMELPNAPYKDWEHLRSCSNGIKQSRATVSSVAHYYEDYVKRKGLEGFFHNRTMVTSVKRLTAPDLCPESNLWEVHGVNIEDDTCFTYITRVVVLATGSFDVPNHLDIPGENHPFILHTLTQLEELIQSGALNSSSDSLLIVGAGLTAADAVISAHFYNIPVTHVFRRDVEDPSLVFNNLPENMYPEYHKVHQMMKGRGVGYRNYRPYPKHQVLGIEPNHKVRLQGPLCSEVIQVSYVLVLIGSKPNLSYLEDKGTGLGRDPAVPVDCRRNPILCDAFSHRSLRANGLYALGPLVGDNFVRFLQGGALAIANHLLQQSTNGSPSSSEENVCDEDDDRLPGSG